MTTPRRDTEDTGSNHSGSLGRPQTRGLRHSSFVIPSSLGISSFVISPRFSLFYRLAGNIGVRRKS